MKSFIRPLATVVMAASLAVSAGSAFAQTQDFEPEFYESQLSGFEINVSGPTFEITAADLQHYSNGDGEVVTIDSELSSAEVSFFDDDDTPDESIDAYLGSLEQVAENYVVVDRDTDGDVSYALASFEYQGVPFIYYVQVTQDVVGNVDFFESFLSTTDNFGSEMGIAQDEIDIDGSGFAENVDADELVDMAANGESSTTTEDSTATDVSEEDESALDAHLDDVANSETASDPREGARLGSNTNADESTPVTEETDDDTPVSDIVGTLTDSSWQGPIFEHEIGWDDNWVVDPSIDGAIVSDEDEQIESLLITSDSYRTTPFIYIAVHDAGGNTPADYLEYWSSDEYLQEQVLGADGGDAEILTTRSRSSGVAIVIQYTDDNETYIMVRQMVELEDGTLMVLVIDTSVDEISQVYSDAHDGITFDGDELPQILTQSQLDRVLGE
ncbi:MAG: hypothetical protein KC435_00560 [Thermomicrobiales bacterium]|nr:hypothetical protein [Thermomicrobiales bacterium]